MDRATSRLSFLVLLLILNACAVTGSRAPSSAAFAIEELGKGDYKLSAPGLAPLRLRFLTSHSFHLGPASPAPRLAKLSEYMIVKGDAAFAPVEVRAASSGAAATFVTTEGIALELRPGPGAGIAVSVARNGSEVISSWTVDPSSHSSTLALRDREHIYGFGDKRAALDQHGNTVKLWNADAFASENNVSYKNVPFYSSSAGYGLFLHNFHVMTYDVGATDRHRLRVDAEGGDMDFYVFLGAGPREIIPQYTELTGRPAMMPRWFFGYHQGRAAPGFKADEGYTVARTMREKKLPIDVVYYDDWDHEAINREFVSRLRNDLHVRLTLGYGMPLVGDYVGVNHDEKPLLSELERRHYLWTDHDGKAIIGPAEEVANDDPNAPNSVAYVDFFNPEAVEYMFEQKFSEPLKAGAALGMADFGELANVEKPHEAFWPSNGLDTEDTHNLYGLAYTSALVDGSRNRTGGRSLGMVRPGSAGSQRLGWSTTGDSKPTYRNFRHHFLGALNLSLSGFSNVGYDIGGWNAHGPDDVYARWFAAGTFNPFMWSHGIGTHEPYAHGAAVEKAARDFLDLRYRLIPYLYSEMYVASSEGTPILRPLPLEVPGEPLAPKTEDEAFLGDGILFAPVFNKEGNREVYLPGGTTWYDLFGELAPVPGGRKVARRKVPLNRIPAYVHAGAILPMGPAMQYTGEKPVDPLDVNFYAWKDGGEHRSSFTLYEDDGETNEYANGSCQFTRFEARQYQGELRFHAEVKRGRNGYAVEPNRSYVLRLHGLAGAAHVEWNGREVAALAPGAKPEAGQAYWRRNPRNGLLLVRLPGPIVSGFDLTVR